MLSHTYSGGLRRDEGATTLFGRDITPGSVVGCCSCCSSQWAR